MLETTDQNTQTETVASPPVESRPKPLRLGELLVSEEVITESQLVKALVIQKDSKPRKRLGEILTEQRMTSDQRIKETVRKFGKNYRIGELLMLLDLITQDQLEEALAYQKEHREMRLGEILLERKFLPERQLLMVLSYHFDIPYIEPDFNLMDRKLISTMSLPYLRRLEVIPMFSDGKTVTVVLSDPTRFEAIREMEQLFGMPVAPAIGVRETILQAIDDFEHLYKESISAGKVDEKGEKDENVISIVNYLLTKAIREGASDIHIEPMENRVRIRYRVDGILVHKTDLPLYLAPRIASRIKVMGEGNVVEKRKHQSGRIVFYADDQHIDLRVSIFVAIHGENVVIRILNAQTGVVALEKLGMNPAMLIRYKEMVLDVPTGVVLFTGPTGSGKTTSLYSSINYCNDMDVKIITAEDPVEYQVEGIVQCSIDDKAGRNFGSTLREIVRQDPDIIVLGEIRDKESANIAIQAALTGHKVFATFHTEDSIGSLLRLMDMDIEAFLISSTVVCVIAQRLVRRICPHCKIETSPNDYERRLLLLHDQPVEKYKWFKGQGCKNCNDTGYRGRVGIYEMLVLNDDVRDAILVKMPAHEVRQLAVDSTNLFTMQEDGIAKAFQGVTTLEEIISHVPRNFRQRPLDKIKAMATQE